MAPRRDSNNGVMIDMLLQCLHNRVNFTGLGKIRIRSHADHFLSGRGVASARQNNDRNVACTGSFFESPQHILSATVGHPKI